MHIAILILTFLLAIAAQFLPFFGGDSYRIYYQGLAGVAAFFLGMTQSAFGKYIADAMTDRRRGKEEKTKNTEDTERKVTRFQPLLQLIRNCLNGNEDEFGNDYDIIMMYADLVFGGGSFLRVNAGSEYEKMKTMVTRLNETGDLTITKRDQSYTRFRLSDELYNRILELTPDAV